MKKIAFLFATLAILGSCQKKQYASFQKSSMPTYASEKKATIAVQPAAEVAKIEAEETAIPASTPMMASSNENDFKSVLASTPQSFEIPAIEEVQAVAKTSIKQSFRSKMIEKAYTKQINKLNKSSKSEVKANGGWKDLNKNIRMGVILILIGVLLVWIPIIGWILGPLAALVGTVLLVLGLIKQFG